MYRNFEENHFENKMIGLIPLILMIALLTLIPEQIQNKANFWNFTYAQMVDMVLCSSNRNKNVDKFTKDQPLGIFKMHKKDII